MTRQFVLERHLVGSMVSKNLRMSTVFNQKENVERVEYSCLEICHVYKMFVGLIGREIEINI